MGQRSARKDHFCGPLSRRRIPEQNGRSTHRSQVYIKYGCRVVRDHPSSSTLCLQKATLFLISSHPVLAKDNSTALFYICKPCLSLHPLSFPTYDIVFATGLPKIDASNAAAPSRFGSFAGGSRRVAVSPIDLDLGQQLEEVSWLTLEGGKQLNLSSSVDLDFNH